MTAKQDVDMLLYKLSKASDHAIPSLLLQIEDLLKQHDKKEIKLLLWDNEILRTLTDVIKQDFDQLRLEWSTATRLSALLLKCCTGFAHPPDFTSVFLPLVVDSCMELANNIQGLASPIIEREFKACMECVEWLVEYCPDLAESVVESPRLLTILMVESTTNIDLYILKMVRLVLVLLSPEQKTDQDKLLVVFDEVMLKMTEQLSPTLQQVGADVIFQAAKRHNAFKMILLDNGAEVEELLESINPAPGSHDNINTLLNYLKQLRLEEAEKERLNVSATKIQACYRGYVTRRTLHQNSQRISKFQLRFRSWLKERKGREEREKERQWELEIRTKIARDKRKTMLLEQANQLRILPADQIYTHQYQVESLAASKIQTAWRMCAARRKVDKMRRSRKESRAAVTIQRQYRQYRGSISCWSMLPPGLTAERVQELQGRVQEILQAEEEDSQTEEQKEKVILRSQEHYLEYTRNLSSIRRVQKRREHLCSQITDRLTQLTNAPSLEDCTLEDARLYSCCADPVILEQARRNHRHAVSSVTDNQSSLYKHWDRAQLDLEIRYSPVTYKIQQLD